MASRLLLEFKDASNATVKFSYNYANPEVAPNDVKSLVQAMITNGSIFAHPPVTAVSAKLIEISESEINLS